MRQPSRRVQVALEKEAALRLARFERAETWESLSSGDQVRIVGHRGGTWHFRAFVTNTSNGASWVEVSETLAAGRGRRTAKSDDEPDQPVPTSMTRVRSFRPEQVIPLRKPRRRRPPAASTTSARRGGRANGRSATDQTSLFDPSSLGD